MIVGHLYTVKSYFIIQYQYKNQLLLVIGIWNIILYWGPQSQKPMLFLAELHVRRKTFMGTSILVSVHNILTVPLRNGIENS